MDGRTGCPDRLCDLIFRHFDREVGCEAPCSRNTPRCKVTEVWLCQLTSNFTNFKLVKRRFMKQSLNDYVTGVVPSAVT